MNIVFQNLNQHVTETIRPSNVSKTISIDYLLNLWNAYFQAELGEVKLQLTSLLLSPAPVDKKLEFTSSAQTWLVYLSDIVNTYLSKERKFLIKNPSSKSLKAHYLLIISEMENFQVEIQKQFPVYFDPKVKFAKLRIVHSLPKLRVKIADLKNHLITSEVPKTMVGLIDEALLELLQPNNLGYAVENYISKLTIEISKIQFVSEDRLLKIMVEFDFNSSDIKKYIFNGIEDRLFHIHGIHDQIEKLIEVKESFGTPILRVINGPLSKPITLQEEILKFCSDKIFYLEERMSVKRAALKDLTDIEDVFRMETKFSVVQLSYFLRLLFDRGIFKRDEVGEYFTFFSRHIYTENAQFISARNLLKKSTEVEFSTALKMWDEFNEIIECLDSEFAIRNFRRDQN